MKKKLVTILLMILTVLFLISGLGTASNLELDFLGCYHSGAGFDEGLTEIVVYDSNSQLAFVTNGVEKAIDILDLSAPANIRRIKRIKIERLDLGSIFTPDGNKILTANGGEPNEEYTIYPAEVNHARFDQSSQYQIDENVRIKKGATIAEDLEPEYITITDNNLAYVFLQENNAVAKLDIDSAKFIHVYGLGFKDHSIAGNEIDVSDEDGRVNIRNWPLLGMYQPDGLASYTIKDKTYSR